MPVIILPKGSLITINSTALSEHNRGPAQISYEIIAISDRTITGTMRRQSLVDKRTLSVSWERLPALDGQTADGKAGRNTIKGIVDTATTVSITPLTVSFYEVNSSNVQVAVNIQMFVDNYSEELIKRFSYQHWNVTLSLVEV